MSIYTANPSNPDKCDCLVCGIDNHKKCLGCMGTGSNIDYIYSLYNDKTGFGTPVVKTCHECGGTGFRS